MTYLAISIYALAIVLANLSVATWGPSVTAINAFFFIGLDLALRNWLSMRMPKPMMLVMIVSTGALSYFINPASGIIAVASVVAFTLASITDWFIFNTCGGAWLRRNLAGNVAGAAVDSLLFPTIAFGSLIPSIVVVQFLAKVAGGSVWGRLLQKYNSLHK